MGGHSRCSFFGEMFSYDARLRNFKDRNNFEKVLEHYRPEFKKKDMGCAVFHSFAGEPHPTFGPIHQTTPFYFERLLKRWNLDKFIILERRNLLARYASHRLAAISGIWQNHKGVQSGASDQVLTISPESLVLDFEHLALVSQLTREKARMNGDYIIVTYEDLCARYEAQMARVFGFMELPYEPVEPMTVKKEFRPLSEIISNYEELKACFKGSKYSWFFEDIAENLFDLS